MKTCTCARVYVRSNECQYMFVTRQCIQCLKECVCENNGRRLFIKGKILRLTCQKFDPKKKHAKLKQKFCSKYFTLAENVDAIKLE